MFPSLKLFLNLASASDGLWVHPVFLSMPRPFEAFQPDLQGPDVRFRVSASVTPWSRALPSLSEGAGDLRLRGHQGDTLF